MSLFPCFLFVFMFLCSQFCLSFSAEKFLCSANLIFPFLHRETGDFSILMREILYEFLLHKIAKIVLRGTNSTPLHNKSSCAIHLTFLAFYKQHNSFVRIFFFWVHLQDVHIHFSNSASPVSQKVCKRFLLMQEYLFVV